MGDVIDLKSVGGQDHGFVVDLARFREGLLDEKAIRKKYRLADDIWEKFGQDDELIRKVEEESVRRVRDGSCKRERAQQLVVQAPTVLGGIMNDVSVSPRNKVDAIKTLDGMATGGPESAPAADRFVITINLGEDVIRFNKSIKPDADDIDPFNEVDTGVIAAIATKKLPDGGDGEPL
jgi:hypothetical protein